jgi:ligand-binding sensor domain-containing protein
VRNTEAAPQQAQSPLPDDYVNAIDGDYDTVYVATRSGLVTYGIPSRFDEDFDRKGYSKLTRPGRKRRDLEYQDQRRGVGSVRRAEQSATREEIWSALGWKFFQLSTIRQKDRAQLSDNFLDIKVHQGQLWIATDRGLIRFEPPGEGMGGEKWGGAYELFNRQNGFPYNEVISIAAIGKQVWAGTPQGLTVRNLDGKGWRKITIEKALPSNYITAVSADRQWMWFGTPGAASRFDIQNQKWKTFTRDDGLTGSQINSIAVVGNYVWFGTDEGISLLDKTTGDFQTFKSPLPPFEKGGKGGILPSNEVTSLLVDGAYVWVGTINGLCRYDKLTDTWNMYSTALPAVPGAAQAGDGIADERINVVAADPKFIWVGTRKGLNVYDKTTEKWRTITKSPLPPFSKGGQEGILSDDVILSIDINDQYIAVGTKTGGISVMDRETWKWWTATVEDGLPSNEAKAVTLDGDHVWIGSRGSITRYNLRTRQTRVFTDADAKGLSTAEVFGASHREPHIWFATDNGIYRYNKPDGTWWTFAPAIQRGKTDMLVDSNIQAIASNQEFVYFGTPLGISRYQKSTGNWVNYTERDGLADSNVRALAVDDYDLWAATERGVSHYDFVADEWRTFTRKDGLPSNDAYSLAIAQIYTSYQSPVTNHQSPVTSYQSPITSHQIWVGTELGAALYDKASGIWTKYTIDDGLPDKEVWAIAVDGVNVWFGTNKGVAVLNTELDKWSWYTVDDGLVDNKVTAIGVTDNYIFLNTPKGATVYDKKLSSFSEFTKMEGLLSETVQSTDSALQYIWFGTAGGATLYDWVTDLPDELFTQRDGLGGDNVQSIKVDGDIVWLGTDSGLSMYNWKTHIWKHFKKAPKVGKETQSVGLISHNIKSLVSDGDFLWVGTREGLSRYDKVTGQWKTMQLRDNPSIRKIAVEGRYLWLGTSKGLILYDKTTETIAQFYPDYAPVRDIDIDGDAVWITTPNQIAQYQRQRYGGDRWITLMGAEIRDMVVDAKPGDQPRIKQLKEDLGIQDCASLIRISNTAWFGRSHGIAVYNVGRQKSEKDIPFPDSLKAQKVTDFAFDGQNAWVGTRDGLYRYGLQTGQWQQFTDADGLCSNHISALAIDVTDSSNPALWVCTADKGVSRYDFKLSPPGRGRGWVTGKWETFTMRDGLSDHNIRDIVVDDRYVWFGTFSGGVCRYDKQSELWTTYRTADYAQKSEP